MKKKIYRITPYGAESLKLKLCTKLELPSDTLLSPNPRYWKLIS